MGRCDGFGCSYSHEREDLAWTDAEVQRAIYEHTQVINAYMGCLSRTAPQIQFYGPQPPVCKPIKTQQTPQASYAAYPTPLTNVDPISPEVQVFSEEDHKNDNAMHASVEISQEAKGCEMPAEPLGNDIKEEEEPFNDLEANLQPSSNLNPHAVEWAPPTVMSLVPVDVPSLDETTANTSKEEAVNQNKEEPDLKSATSMDIQACCEVEPTAVSPVTVIAPSLDEANDYSRKSNTENQHKEEEPGLKNPPTTDIQAWGELEPNNPWFIESQLSYNGAYLTLETKRDDTQTNDEKEGAATSWEMPGAVKWNEGPTENDWGIPTDPLEQEEKHQELPALPSQKEKNLQKTVSPNAAPEKSTQSPKQDKKQSRSDKKRKGKEKEKKASTKTPAKQSTKASGNRNWTNKSNFKQQASSKPLLRVIEVSTPTPTKDIPPHSSSPESEPETSFSPTVQLGCPIPSAEMEAKIRRASKDLYKKNKQAKAQPVRAPPPQHDVDPGMEWVNNGAKRSDLQADGSRDFTEKTRFTSTNSWVTGNKWPAPSTE